MTRDELKEWAIRPTSHYECEDCWYSCSTICCDDWRKSDECDCGADQENAAKLAVLNLLETSKP